MKFAPEVKAAAIELAKQTSAAEVERRMGIDQTTVNKWLIGLGIEAAPVVGGPGYTEAARAYWREWKEQTALRAAKTVENGFDLADAAALDGSTRNFREAVLGTTMMIDKVLTLTGHATSHVQSSVNVQLDIGYSDQMVEFARIDSLRRASIEASSTSIPSEITQDASTVIEGTVVTNE